MVQLIARRALTYAGKRYEVGATFKATPGHAFLMRAAKTADYAPKPAPAPVVTPAPAPKRRGRPPKVKAETPAPVAPTPDDEPEELPVAPEEPLPDDEEDGRPPGAAARREKRVYRRRDMQAER
jgi:hypothetical protein